MAEDQFVARSGHADVEEPPLLLDVRVAFRQRLVHELLRKGQRIAPRPGREPAVDEPGHEHDRELQALGLVHGEDRHGVGVRVHLRCGGIIAGVDQRLEMRRHENDPVVGQQVRLGPDDVEEAGDVLERLLGGNRVRRGQPRQQAALAQELVQHLAGRPFVGEIREAPDVGYQPLQRGPRLGRQPQQAGLARQLLEDLPQRSVATACAVDDGREVRPAHAVDIRRSQGIDVHAGGEIRDGPQKRQQQPDLRPRVQPGCAREPPRHRHEIETPQNRLRIRVGADQDGEVLWLGPVGDPAGDLPRHLVRLLGSGREDPVPDRQLLSLALRHQPLVYAVAELEAVRIVEADEPVARVQDWRTGAVVAPQDDLANTRMTPLELQDVADGGAAELVDRLVVVADYRDVAVGRGQKFDQLRLGPVCVLELVHEDVPVAALEFHPGRGRLSEQLQAQADLVTEIDVARLPKQRLVAVVGAGKLGLAASLLLERRGGVGGGVGRSRVAGDRGRQARCRSCRKARGVLEIGRRAHVLVLAPAEQRRQGTQKPRGIAQGPVLVQLELEEPLPQEYHDLRAREDPRVRGQPELQRELPNEPIAERVKRGDGRVRVAVRHQLIDARLHLVGGLVREGQGQDLGRPGPPSGDQPGDAASDDLGLARPGAGDDQQRAFAVAHRPPLFRVEPGEERLHSIRGTGRDLVNLRR